MLSREVLERAHEQLSHTFTEVTKLIDTADEREREHLGRVARHLAITADHLTALSHSPRPNRPRASPGA